MELNVLLQAVQTPLSISDREQIVAQLENYIGYLMEHDFERLLQVLYTVDIEEEKLKHMLLQQSHRDASSIIAAMILERQQQKEAARKQFRVDTLDENAERW